ncbi:MAG: nicotinate (nicotinamide) nucleotide adenylyltransferase [Deltaproteobacteria bacterium]|nr:nicotinate (nicotinamide) nucleotide adenylyltransferase [Deltaproteobacteria bacterium]
MRIGILGGTFDPIHLGHLRLAEEVGEALDLDRVHLIPAAVPPHKGKRPVTPFHHRLAMIRIAAGESPLLEATDLEGRRQGLSYSIETLREFHALYGAGLHLFFLVGMDAFLEIESWKEYQRLFDYAHFVVIKRPGIPSEGMEPFLLSLDAGFRRKGRGPDFIAPSGNEILYFEATLMDISSTRIREVAARAGSIRFLVPERVREYIEDTGLYRIHGES